MLIVVRYLLETCDTVDEAVGRLRSLPGRRSPEPHPCRRLEGGDGVRGAGHAADGGTGCLRRSPGNSPSATSHPDPAPWPWAGPAESHS
ncbi:hypothetical protein [Streptomyces armeniacus]|uniref:hypothetical protein n=1 Tax=Streptomyces armeniacus TaxID=83291 RepID=UPI00319DA6B6